MSEIKQTKRVTRLLSNTKKICKDYRHEFIMPEHLLLALVYDENFNLALNRFISPQHLIGNLESFMERIETIPSNIDYEPETSIQMMNVIDSAAEDVSLSSAEFIDIPHLVNGILKLKDSWASYLLKDSLDGKEASFMSELIGHGEVSNDADIKIEETTAVFDWRKAVICMNSCCMEMNPLIGREHELRRTIQVLCRRDKNNPLHVGEPGVGKTALVWGLACLIEKKQVPARLIGSKIYQIDMGTILAGTQYRGDFENRIKQIMDGIQKENDNNIVYIDGIHTIVGAGATGDGGMDASNLLKPYLEAGHVRFIGSTTYEEYNRRLSRSKGLLRNFQQIDILEPTIEETKNIILQLRSCYETFHNVSYTDEAIEFAIESSVKYINERFLPDKAIDLIDEAGAAKEFDRSTNIVGKSDIIETLTKICKVSTLAESEEKDYDLLENLSSRMLSQIYGQDDAIRLVVETIQMSNAGLLDEDKPLASFLFVGPTGVGKTELARVLSKELGTELIRFDMSEYVEKHAVAKLIGAPAGYIGYEDGGLLTDAVRKSPNCVLLLDEIEKAHDDIYNILLQVMDYAQLTDNKGRHTDFRNVILIMTSNAGARFASQASIGFVGSISRGEAMMKQVKKTFKPEFLNRLTSTVVFHDMDKRMAALILKKKLRELEIKLEKKQVHMELSPAAFDYMLSEGFTVEYGAREMDRIISRYLKPLLMREILFGRLKNGGTTIIDIENGSFSIR